MAILNQVETLAACRRGLRRTLALLFGGLWLTTGLFSAETPASREYQIKAAFIFNFTQFVDWPSTALPPDGSPWKIGVLGADPFGTSLDSTLQGESVRGRKLTVVRSQKASDLLSCQVVFVSASEKGSLPSILTEFRPAPVLTVSDIEGFSAEGGIITLFKEGNRMRFEVNADQAKKVGLRISSNMLKLGKIVSGQSAGGEF